MRVGSTFNSVDEIGNFREEGVIVLSCQPDSDDGKRVRMSWTSPNTEGRKDEQEMTYSERVPLLVIISRSSVSSVQCPWLMDSKEDVPDVKSGLLVWIDQSHMISIGPDL